jgi:predicted transposase YbfD/YdcC
VDKGHGRLERRTIHTTTVLKGYSDWPGLEQAFLLERQRTVAGKTTTETAYGITSLPRHKADAQTLLRLTRDHWGIENRLHWVRDMTFGEDACRVRKGSAPQILAAFRNVAIRLLNAAGCRNIAARLRRHAAQPALALALIRGDP